jgi:hypothetical protein
VLFEYGRLEAGVFKDAEKKNERGLNNVGIYFSLKFIKVSGVRRMKIEKRHFTSEKTNGIGSIYCTQAISLLLPRIFRPAFLTESQR